MKNTFLALLIAMSINAQAQFVPGQILTAQQLNTQLALYLPLAGGTLTGPLTSTTINSPTINSPIINGIMSGTVQFVTTGSAQFASIVNTPIDGTTSGTAAGSGVVGQPITNSGTGTSITSGATVNAASISVPAGDWDCWGNATFLPTASTAVSNIAAGLTTTPMTLPPLPASTYLGTTLTTGTSGATTLNPTVTIENVSSGTTLYLVAEAGTVTGGSGLTVNGYITCRRRH